MFTLLYFSFTCLCVYTETNIWLWYVLCMHMYFVELICYPSHHRCNNPKNASQYWHDLSQDLTPSHSKHTLGEVRHHVVKSLFFGRMVFLAKVESTTVCTWDSPGPGHKGFPARWSIGFAFVAYPVVLWYAHQEPNCRIQEQFSSLRSWPWFLHKLFLLAEKCSPKIRPLFGFSRPSALMTPSSAQTINNLNIYYGQIMFNLNIIWTFVMFRWCSDWTLSEHLLCSDNVQSEHHLNMCNVQMMCRLNIIWPYGHTSVLHFNTPLIHMQTDDHRQVVVEMTRSYYAQIEHYLNLLYVPGPP